MKCSAAATLQSIGFAKQPLCTLTMQECCPYKCGIVTSLLVDVDDDEVPPVDEVAARELTELIEQVPGVLQLPVD